MFLRPWSNNEHFQGKEIKNCEMLPKIVHFLIIDIRLYHYYYRCCLQLIELKLSPQNTMSNPNPFLIIKFTIIIIFAVE